MLRRLPPPAVLACIVFLDYGALLAQHSSPKSHHLDQIEIQPPIAAQSALAPRLVTHIADVDIETPPEQISVTAAPADDSICKSTPTCWLKSVGWDGGVEIGINGTEGNAEAVSIRTGINLTRTAASYELSSDLTYLKASADGVETQHNTLQNTRYEHLFDESPWRFFLRESIEYDEFKAFDLRLAVNSGIGYQFLKTPLTTFKGRFGAGVSHEFGGPSDDSVPEAVYGVDAKRQLTERQKLVLTVDYFPEWGRARNYRIVTDLAWEVLLDEAHNLNLKISVNDRYDSTPNGRKANDVNYALLLLWKL